MTRMIFRILIWFLLLLAAGVLAHFMVREPGYVMITWGRWKVETTLWTAAGTLIVLALVAWLLWWLIRRTNPIALVRRYRDSRDRKLARVETEKAVKSWLQGDENAALAALDKVVKAGGSERLPRALSLIPAQHSGDWESRVARFNETDPGLAIVAQVLEAEQRWQAGDKASFLAWMDRHPELISVKHLQHRYWQALLTEGRAEEVYKGLSNLPHLNPSDRERWQQHVGLALLQQCQQEDTFEPTKLKTIPRKVRQQPELVAAEVRCLVKHQRVDEAFRLLKKHLEREANDTLVALLVEEPFDTAQALKLAEQIESRQKDRSATLSWVLGVLCEREALWGKAEDYLNDAWRQETKPTIGLALANLYETRGQTDKARAIYKTLAQRTEEGAISLG